MTQPALLRIAETDGRLVLLGSRLAGGGTAPKLNHFFRHVKLISYCSHFVFRGESWTDTDWGCVLRAGQMLVCNFLIFRGGFLVQSDSDSSAILALFLTGGPLSIQRFLEKSGDLGLIPVGEMWRADTFCAVLRDLVSGLTEDSDGLQRVHLSPTLVTGLAVTSETSVVSIPKLRGVLQTASTVLFFLHVCVQAEPNDTRPHQFLFEVMQTPHFSGALASEGLRSYYFVGWAGDSLLYLDPHVVSSEEDLRNGVRSKVGSLNHLSFNSLGKMVTLAFALNPQTLQDFEARVRDLSLRFGLIAVVGDETQEQPSRSLEALLELDPAFLMQVKAEGGASKPGVQLGPPKQLGSFWEMDTVREV